MLRAECGIKSPVEQFAGLVSWIKISANCSHPDQRNFSPQRHRDHRGKQNKISLFSSVISVSLWSIHIIDDTPRYGANRHGVQVNELQIRDNRGGKPKSAAMPRRAAQIRPKNKENALRGIFRPRRKMVPPARLELATPALRMPELEYAQTASSLNNYAYQRVQAT